MRLARVLFLLAVLAGLSTTVSAKTIIYVDAAATGAGSGANWQDAFVYLQDALELAATKPNTEIEIRVAQGTYRSDQSKSNPAGTLAPAATFKIQAGITLLGGYAGGSDPLAYDPAAYVTVLSGTLDSVANVHSYHVVSASWNSILQDVTIEGGRANGAGADAAYPAIVPTDGGLPTLINVKFRNNRSLLRLDVVPEAGTTESFAENTLMLTLDPAYLYIQPGESILFSVDAYNLNDRANMCNLEIGYPGGAWSLFSKAQPDLILPGGGYWNDLVSLNVGTAGTISMIVGTGPWGNIGTVADGPVALVALTSTGRQGRDELTLDGSSLLVRAPDYPLPPTGPMVALQPMNVVTAPVPVVVDGTVPTIQLTKVRHVAAPNTDLLLPNPTVCIPGTNCASDPQAPPGWPVAGEGVVLITVRATDPALSWSEPGAGLASAPTLVVTTAQGMTYDITGTRRPVGNNDWVYSFSVTKAMDAGLAGITACVTDLAGNRVCIMGHIVLAPVLKITGTVELQGFVGSYNWPTIPREVLFVATDSTGKALGCWRQTLQFSNTGSAAFELDASGLNAADIANLSAKTAWHLRTRVKVTAPQVGVLAAEFTAQNGGRMLRAGDLIGGGTKNCPEKAADLPGIEVSALGSGAVNVLDLAYVTANFGTGVYNYWADVDGNGVVDQLDLNLVNANLNQKDQDE